MQDFLNKYRANPLIYYSLVVFNGSSARALLSSGADTQPVFSNDPAKMDTAIAQFQVETDNGLPPYHAALTMATSAIGADRAADKSGVVSAFYVVLMSDGQPTDYGKVPDLVATDTDIKTLILTAGQATLSTIYYNPANVAGDVAVIQNMAQIGNGGFSNVNVDGREPLDQII